MNANTYNPLEGLTTRQIERIFRIRADRKRRSVRAEAERALANPSNLVELSSYAVLKETLRIDCSEPEDPEERCYTCEKLQSELRAPLIYYETPRQYFLYCEDCYCSLD